MPVGSVLAMLVAPEQWSPARSHRYKRVAALNFLDLWPAQSSRSTRNQTAPFLCGETILPCCACNTKDGCSAISFSLTTQTWRYKEGPDDCIGHGGDRVIEPSSHWEGNGNCNLIGPLNNDRETEHCFQFL